MKEVTLGIGTNLSDREKNLQDALCFVKRDIGRITKASSVYETEPWGFSSEDPFLNMVIMVQTWLSPLAVLEKIQETEAQLGRVRDNDRYSSRIIDIDILLYGDKIVSKPGLKIPHPLLHERKFVLVPLCEFAPDAVHPVLKKTFGALLEECKDERKVKKIKLSTDPLYIFPQVGKEIQ